MSRKSMQGLVDQGNSHLRSRIEQLQRAAANASECLDGIIQRGDADDDLMDSLYDAEMSANDAIVELNQLRGIHFGYAAAETEEAP